MSYNMRLNGKYVSKSYNVSLVTNFNINENPQTLLLII